MSLEGKKEFVAEEQVFCRALGGNLKIKNCERCDHFHGINTLVRKVRGNDGVVREEGSTREVLCRCPTREKIIPLLDIED